MVHRATHGPYFPKASDVPQRISAARVGPAKGSGWLASTTPFATLLTVDSVLTRRSGLRNRNGLSGLSGLRGLRCSTSANEIRCCVADQSNDEGSRENELVQDQNEAIVVEETIILAAIKVVTGESSVAAIGINTLSSAVVTDE